MKNLLLLLCSLLLNGVFGDTDEVNVSVKEGDSVTLEIKPEDINGAEELVWRFNDRIIAKIDLEVKDRPPEYSDERFTDRLNLEHQTGSLTITNITSEDSGLYHLEIRSSSDIKHKTFRVSVSGVFGDTEVKVSVKERDSVTIKIKPEDIHGATELAWWFKGEKIANIDLEGTDTPPVYPDERFRDRLSLERQTGSLTITNITSEHSGEYKLEIRRITGIMNKTFRVSVSVKSESVSVDVGADFTLCHDITDIQRDDVIQWTFEGTLIAHSHRTLNNVPDRFSGRLSLGWNGSLNLNNFRPEDSGLYEVNITGSKHIPDMKTFNVTGKK